jgi:hypothetical protein
MTTEAIDQAISIPFVDVRKELDEIAIENASLVFDYESEEGEKAARSQLFKLKRINGAIDAIHKEIKKEYLIKGRMVDAVKKDLRSRVAEMIAVHQAPLDEIADRETKRLDAIESAFREITQIPEQIGMTTKLPDALKLLDMLLAIEVTQEVFQERYVEASSLYDQTLDDLENYIRTAKENEKRDRELAALKRKQDEQDRIERESKIAEQAAAKAVRELEAKAAVEKEHAKQRLEEANQAVVQAAERANQRIEQAKKKQVKAEAKAESMKESSKELKTKIEQVKKTVDTEKRRLLMMFADFLVDEYAIGDATGDQLVDQFFQKYPNVA